MSLNRNYIYKGLTADLDERLKRHNAGRENTTAPYRPFRLIYSKEYKTRSEARIHEKWLKSSAGRHFLKKLTKDNT